MKLPFDHFIHAVQRRHPALLPRRKRTKHQESLLARYLRTVASHASVAQGVPLESLAMHWVLAEKK